MPLSIDLPMDFACADLFSGTQLPELFACPSWMWWIAPKRINKNPKNVTDATSNHKLANEEVATTPKAMEPVEIPKSKALAYKETPCALSVRVVLSRITVRRTLYVNAKPDPIKIA